MSITRENYEEYAISYLEGEMTPSEVEQFIAFMIDHPDLAEEIDSIRDFIVLNTEIASSFSTDNLKKDINTLQVTTQNFDEFCIAWYENDLNDTGKQSLSNYIISHPETEQRFKTYGELILEPDTNIVFTSKKLLQKDIAVRPVLRINRRRLAVYSSIAASVILLISLTYKFIGLYSPTIDTTVVVTTNYQVKNFIKKPQTENKDFIVAEQTTKAFPTKGVSAVKQNQEKDIEYDQNITRETLAIMPIESKAATIEPSIIARELQSPDSYYFTETENSSKSSFLSDLQAGDNKLFSVIRHLNFDRILQKSVKGINQMAETDLKYQSETDENGNITAFSITSESFNIKRVRRN